MNLSTLGGPGLRQMSVGTCVVSWKELDVGDGGVALLLMKLKGSCEAIVKW